MPESRPLELDRERLAALAETLGMSVGALVQQLANSIELGIEQLDAALAGDDLKAAADRAHSVRNDALMLDVTEFETTLEGIENAALSRDRSAATGGCEELHRLWPELRAELRKTTHRGR
jgi:HPt (histidine-containing phosphotransfer) domain-containing protein